MTDAPLSAAGLTRTFGGVTALSDVSVEAQADAVTAVIGPNGSGKTTLLRLLVGVDRPTAGTVERPSGGDSRRVGYLPQRPTFRPEFTVREIAAFYAALAADDPDRLLDRVGLDAVEDRSVGGLSGGMTRLLGIAQALAGDPPVVVLDEPTSGLDPATRGRVFEVIESLAADGRAVLLASHALAPVERMADRLVVLESGSVAARDTPAALRDRTGGPLSETFTDLLADPDAGFAVQGGGL